MHELPQSHVIRPAQDSSVWLGLTSTEQLMSPECSKHQVLSLAKISSIQETDTFTSTTKSESFKINHKLNFDDNCLIYLLTCKCCGKQYVGETTDKFRLRWNNYKSNDRKNARKEARMQEHLF